MKDFILEQINEFNYPNPDGTTGRERFFGLAGAVVSSYTGRREQFLGGTGLTNRRRCWTENATTA